MYYGTASATLNGKTWQATKVRSNNIPSLKDKLGFEFNVYNHQGFLRETLIFYQIPNKVGTYNIYPLNYNVPQFSDTSAYSTYHTSQDDGDVALDDYNAIASLNNYFTIAKYNDRTKELWGSFSVTFIIDSRQARNSPDTIKVTNGSFYTKILN